MNRSNQPNDPDSISEIEEIDGEEERGSGRRYDLLLGIPLILAVVLFAGWQWWHTEYQTSQYQAGQEAAGRNDLDGALHYYAEASGYSNADVLVESLREQIADRDRLYKSATDFAGEGKWLNALRDVRDAARIQPGYKDLAALEDKALDHVYTDALSGTVVQRSQADPPGLYIRNAEGWSWLEGSDAESSVIDMSHSGQILYDIQSGNKPAPSPTPQGVGSFKIRSLYDANRAVVMAQPAGDGTHYVSTKLGIFLNEPSLAGKDGFWMLQPSESNNDDEASIFRVAPRYGRILSYQRYSAAAGYLVSIEPTRDGSTGNMVLDIDPNSSRYLLAEWTGLVSTNPSLGANIKLYLRDVESDEKQLVFSIDKGGLFGAMISPDGRYVLVNAYRKIEHDGQPYAENTVYLVDLQDGRKTVTVKSIITEGNPQSESAPPVSAGFVQEGVFKGKVLVASFEKGFSDIGSIVGSEIIQMFSPSDAMDNLDLGTKMITTVVRGDHAGFWQIAAQNSEGLILQVTGLYDANSPDKDQVSLVSIDKDGRINKYTLQGPDNGSIATTRLTDKSLVWSVFEYGDQGFLTAITQSVYLTPRLTKDNQTANYRSPDLVYQSSNSNNDPAKVVDLHRVFYRANLGDTLMGYVEDSALHVHSYDEDVDLTLEAGVGAIWPIRGLAQSLGSR